MRYAGPTVMLIKKYGNRRLYDTVASTYITLEELAARIRAGADVQVVDAKTNQDLTQATLTQIIIEGRGAARLLPVPLLVQLIRMGDDALAEFFGRYMSWALEVYVQAKQSALSFGQFNPFGGGGFANPFARMMGGVPPWQEPQAPAPVTAPAGPTPMASEVAALRKELQALKRSVGRRKK